jgi:uncharacterized membrane protein YidH (DUF202 family)
MDNLWIIYNVFLRKTYKKWYKGRSQQVNSLALMFIMFNFMTVSFLLEWLFPIKGFIYLSHSKVIPMAPTAMLVFGILYGIIYLIFPPKKYNIEKIKIIRRAFEKTNAITRGYVITYLIISFVMFMVSMILLFHKYN